MFSTHLLSRLAQNLKERSWVSVNADVGRLLLLSRVSPSIYLPVTGEAVSPENLAKATETSLNRAPPRGPRKCVCLVWALVQVSLTR